MPLAEWLSWRGSFIHHIGLIVSSGLTYVLALAVLALPGSLISLCIARHRRNAGWMLLCSPIAVACFFFGLQLSLPIKRHMLEKVMARAEPLIVAVRKFETANGKPPLHLFALVPNQIAAIPTPGIGTSPEFGYRLPKPGEEGEGNPWMLIVHPPVAGIGFDVFIYLPKQNYPETGWGGYLERMGNWAYVHE